MTAPLPPDITELLADLQTPLPDPAHDLLRAKVLSAMQSVWNYHVALENSLTGTQGDLSTTNTNLSQVQTDLATAQQNITTLQSQVADLQTRVTALENPTPPPA